MFVITKDVSKPITFFANLLLSLAQSLSSDYLQKTTGADPEQLTSPRAASKGLRLSTKSAMYRQMMLN